MWLQPSDENGPFAMVALAPDVPQGIFIALVPLPLPAFLPLAILAPEHPVPQMIGRRLRDPVGAPRSRLEPRPGRTQEVTTDVMDHTDGMRPPSRSYSFKHPCHPRNPW